MFTSRAQKISALAKLLAVLLTFATILSARSGDGGTDAGSVISNRAEASYSDEFGENYTTVSPTVTVTVLAVATLIVTPDETASSELVVPHDHITRLFRVCNTGNTVDTISLTRFNVTAPATLTALYFDNDGSGTLTNGDAQISLNETASPQLSPRGCIGVLAVIDTNDIPSQSILTITTTARSNATNAVNGRGEDEGTIINAVGLGAHLTDPNNASLAPSKLINDVAQTVVNQAGEFTYTVAFKNSGDTAARNVLLQDQLPTAIAYSAASLQVNDRSVSDAVDNDEGSVQSGVIRVNLAKVDPGETVRVAFRARLTGMVPAGSGLVNIASLTADNAPPISTTRATVIVDPLGLVFAGRGGSSAPIAGAHVEVLTDPNLRTLVSLLSDEGYAPNEKNVNPFVSDGLGHFAFTLGANQFKTDNNYFMRVSAQGYMDRAMQLSIRPTPLGLFSLRVHALDDQPLAVAGGFELVREDVNINDLGALVMNIPMFEPTGLQIVKSADRAQAEIGDTITYRIEVHNPTSAPVRDVVIKDKLPASFHFAEGSARISLGSETETLIEPQLLNGELQFRIAEIAAGATARLLYRLRIGANASEGDQTNIAVASGMFPSGEKTTSATGRAVVRVSAGVFSSRQVIVGRVFVDTNGNQQFDDDDRPMPGVRLYLSNGQSVITDSEGLYNFPSLGDGPQVISLDPVSLPPGYALTDGGRESGKAWTRLLRTPVGGGALLRQNFVLTQKDKTAATTKSAAPGASPSPAPVATGTPAVAARPETKPAPAPVTTDQNGQRTYETAAADNVEPVAPGEVRIISPAPNSVSMSPGAEIEARTALNWNVKLEINGEQISEKNIGVRRLDHKNQVATFTFVGINLKPGANKIRCTAISPEGAPGKPAEIMVMGRGPATHLQIVSEKSEIQSGGSDSTIVRVKALDEWNNPALDGQVGIETSAGQLTRLNEKSEAPLAPLTPLAPPAQSAGVTNSPERLNQTGSQMVVQLENGEAVLKLIGSGAPGEARLHAQTGQIETEERIRITSEMRRPILVGFAEMSFGNSIPEVNLRNEQGKYRSRLSFFYSGRVFGNNMLTLSYDSQRPINRTAGRDRLFQLDPLDRVYPLFGDSSTRFEAAPSNSKVYARLDHKRSFVMFGDFDTGMDAPLSGYARKLTGVQAHLENSQGDFITVTGARPDTAFARDVFPGGTLGIIQLSSAEILPGSEIVTLELRDRRNPEVIISRETLVRSVDYNLDPLTGRLFFLRYVSTFDRVLNLMQVVVTYEHRASSMSSAVYTARARKSFKKIGLKLGFSAALQRESTEPDFFLGGVDVEKTLPRGGSLQLAWATSQGEILGSGNLIETNELKHGGTAYQLTLSQPLPFFGSTVRARYQNASEGFLNPFGGTVTAGSRRGEVSVEMKPGKKSVLRFGITTERNQTENVDNGRLTLSAAMDQTIQERVKLHFGFDHRSLTDDLNDKQTDSNLVTIGAEIQATDKLQFSVKREQNLGDSDPTYPTQTTLGATYQVNALTKLFFTQRLAAAPIVPIADFTANGFAGTQSRRETAIGIETRFGKYTAMTGRYQLENGINGTDSFAVIGLQNRLPINKKLSLDLGFERGFHLAGPNESFNSATVGFGWQPNSDFRASARYEYRDRGGLGQLFSVGAAGKLREGITALSRFQFSRGSFAGRSNETTEGMAALAIRPVASDASGLLFSYTHRSMTQETDGIIPTRDRSDSLATDGYHQLTKRLELYGRVALRLGANGQPGLPFVSTLSFLTQARAQYLLTRRLDWAVETRMLIQPSSGTARSTYATEIGFWVLPDLRLGGGYNLTSTKEPAGSDIIPGRRGFYFTISSKISNLFDLFGTSKAGLDSNAQPAPHNKEQK
jgi:uncharacterized repeat protein (TIGR01451 family)